MELELLNLVKEKNNRECKGTYYTQKAHKLLEKLITLQLKNKHKSARLRENKPKVQQTQIQFLKPEKITKNAIKTTRR